LLSGLLILGLFFPAISLVTLVLSGISNNQTGKSSSPVIIPLIGPILLTMWVFASGYSLWLIPLVWLCDLGTIALIWLFPWLAMELWRTSRFTRNGMLSGEEGNRKVVVTLHRGGHYVLRSSWQSGPIERGVSSIGESGRFVKQQGVLEIESHAGRKRRILPDANGAYIVRELEERFPESDMLNLSGWRLVLEGLFGER
jgi:hypothetical protein